MQKYFLHIALLITLFLCILFFFKPQIFTYKFNTTLIDRYFCSQDIPYEPPCSRVWLSDEELHIAAGYLYATGSDPAVIDFQHMPFIAYLFGFSVLLFNNPYVIQIILGLIFVNLLFYLGIKLFKKPIISFTACFLLIIDPVFIDLAGQASYGIGQGVFILLYIISILYYPRNFIFQGITLGLLASAKFWGAPIFFVFFTALYQLIRKQFNVKIFLYHLFVAFFVFSLTYIKSFFNNGFRFNIILFQLKVVKFWLDHSITNIPFASLILFVTGYFKSWWGNMEVMRAHLWTLLWPISLIASTGLGIRLLFKKKITFFTLTSFFPILYLLYLGIQAPFPRYFILIIPYSYLSLSYITYRLMKKALSRKKF